MNEEEKHINKYRKSDKALESDEMRMAMRGLDLDSLLERGLFRN